MSLFSLLTDNEVHQPGMMAKVQALLDREGISDVSDEIPSATGKFQPLTPHEQFPDLAVLFRDPKSVDTITEAQEVQLTALIESFRMKIINCEYRKEQLADRIKEAIAHNTREASLLNAEARATEERISELETAREAEHRQMADTIDGLRAEIDAIRASG